MARTVFIDPAVRGTRRMREDERAVCRSWAKHAAKCPVCNDPNGNVRDGRPQICDRGRAYAVDVAQYIYAKGSKPFSVIDKAHYGQRNELEIPIEYDAVRDLVKAFQKGLVLAQKPRVSHDRNYYVKTRNETPFEIKITPNSSRREREPRYHDDNRRKTVHFGDTTYHGSLYHADELARQQRRRYENEPVIILAEPKRSSRYNR